MSFLPAIRSSNRLLRCNRIYIRTYYKKQRLGNSAVLIRDETHAQRDKAEADSDFVPYLHNFKELSNTVSFESKYTDIDELHPSTPENKVTKEDWIKDKFNKSRIDNSGDTANMKEKPAQKFHDKHNSQPETPGPRSKKPSPHETPSNGSTSTAKPRRKFFNPYTTGPSPNTKTDDEKSDTKYHKKSFKKLHSKKIIETTESGGLGAHFRRVPLDSEEKSDRPSNGLRNAQSEGYKPSNGNKTQVKKSFKSKRYSRGQENATDSQSYRRKSYD